MILKTRGIVLKTFDFRETSRIATFFTQSYGKVKGVLKGIRKDSRKFGSSVDQFSENDIVYDQYRNSDLHLISQCDLRNFFPPIRRDIKKILAASYVLELVDAIMPSEEPNGNVYALMLDYLSSLEAIEDVSKLVHIFQIKILLLSGFRPHLDSCLVCKKDVSGQAKFSSQLGGLVCLRCRLDEPHVTLVSRGAVASLLHIERSDWQVSLRLGISEPIKKELKFLLNDFLVFHLDRQLKTAKYL